MTTRFPPTRALVRGALTVALLAGACASPSVVEVTLTSRDGLGAIDELVVEVTNNGDRASSRFDVAGRQFPLTFTVTPDGRSGQLEILVSAVNELDTTVAVATASVAIADGKAISASSQLEPADFVINSVTDGAQRTAFRPGRNGRALAATEDGFVVTFVNDCLGSNCDVFVRGFDSLGSPVAVGGSVAEIAVNTADEPRVSVPAIARNGLGEIGIVWETDDAVRFSRIDAGGQLATADLKITADTVENPADPAIIGLASSFELSWYQENDTPLSAGIQRAQVTGSTVSTITTVRADSKAATVSMAGNETALARVWSESESVLAAVGPAGGVGAPQIVATFTGEFPAATQVATLGSGFVASYGRQSNGTSGGIMLTQLAANGAQVRNVVIAETSDRATDRPSIAVDADGRVAVVWTACEEAGEPDGDGCAILFELLDSDLSPLSPPRVINTTRTDDQFDPAVVATPIGFAVVWTDNSGAAPDSSMGIRGRILYIDALL